MNLEYCGGDSAYVAGNVLFRKQPDEDEEEEDDEEQGGEEDDDGDEGYSE